MLVFFLFEKFLKFLKSVQRSGKMSSFVGVVVILVLLTAFNQIIAKPTNERHDIRSPIVRIPYLGRLKGTLQSTKWTNRTFYQFLGVPYAEAPSGARRFKPPVPAKPWHGVRSAVEMGQSCVQLETLSKPSESSKDIEDCLNMNIFTPLIPFNIQIEQQLPVMVFVHGGSFTSGSNAEYPPSYLLEHDIVLVVPNYRLGALGFLSTKSEEIPGNAGMLDVLMALKWVKRYIKHFGGNPNQITVVGQSSGGAMVSSLLVSPSVPFNLFQRMIIHSGSIFAPWSWALDPVSYARDIAARANVPKNATLREINDAFMNMNVYDLINAANEHYNVARFNGANQVGGRSLTVGGPSNYLPQPPKELLRMGYLKKNIDLIAGVVQNEGSFLTAPLYDTLKLSKLLTNAWFMQSFVNVSINLLGVQDRFKEVSNFAQHIFATQIAKSDSNFDDYADGFSQLAGTVSMKEPILKLVQANQHLTPSKTYLYSFDYKGAHSRFGFGADVSQYPFDGGVSHQDDLIYLFPYPPSVANLNADDTAVAKNMVDLWTSFLENGTPQLKTNLNFMWPPFSRNSYSGQSGPYLHINKDFDLGDDFIDEFTIV